MAILGVWALVLRQDGTALQRPSLGEDWPGPEVGRGCRQGRNPASRGPKWGREAEASGVHSGDQRAHGEEKRGTAAGTLSLESGWSEGWE